MLRCIGCDSIVPYSVQEEINRKAAIPSLSTQKAWLVDLKIWGRTTLEWRRSSDSRMRAKERVECDIAETAPVYNRFGVGMVHLYGLRSVQ